MKILVTVKRVVDYNVKVRPKSDHSAVDLDNVKMSINPFCEIAVEEAVRLKEKGVCDEAIALCIGPPASTEQLRTALALGLDRAILIVSEENLEPLAIAKIIAGQVKKEGIDLVIMGKQSIDGDNNQTGQMTAAQLDWPQATFASAIEMSDNSCKVTREVDGGLQVIDVNLPAIVTTDLRLNEPRYAKLPNIMKARKKPLEEIPVDSLGIDIAPRLKVLKVTPPAQRQAGIMVETTEELVDKLKNEAKVL